MVGYSFRYSFFSHSLYFFLEFILNALIDHFFRKRSGKGERNWINHCVLSIPFHSTKFNFIQRVNGANAGMNELNKMNWDMAARRSERNKWNGIEWNEMKLNLLIELQVAAAGAHHQFHSVNEFTSLNWFLSLAANCFNWNKMISLRALAALRNQFISN